MGIMGLGLDPPVNRTQQTPPSNRTMTQSVYKPKTDPGPIIFIYKQSLKNFLNQAEDIMPG